VSYPLAIRSRRAHVLSYRYHLAETGKIHNTNEFQEEYLSLVIGVIKSRRKLGEINPTSELDGSRRRWTARAHVFHSSARFQFFFATSRSSKFSFREGKQKSLRKKYENRPTRASVVILHR
jgi:hypothetical protein